jgi:hypothetical protein
MEIGRHGDGDKDTQKHGHGDIKRKTETEAQVIYLNLFINCSSCIWKIVICPFVDEEKNESYLSDLTIYTDIQKTSCMSTGTTILHRLVLATI